jgi:hypothetical protein
MDLRVALPCRVHNYNKDRQEVDLQPLIKKQYRQDDEIVSMPIIPSVPVHFQSSDGGNAFISLPIKVDDLGFCIVCDRSIDKWLSGTGQEVLPNDNRIHDLTDAIFIPGLRPFQNPLTGVLEDDILIKNTLSSITLKPDGELVFENSLSKITIKANGDIEIESAGLTKILATGNVEITAAILTCIASISASITAPILNFPVTTLGWTGTTLNFIGTNLNMTGAVKMTSLAGVGDRPVKAHADGTLFT